MKRKLAVIMLMVFAMPLFSTTGSQANAAALEDRLLEAAAANPTATQIQELIKIRETLSQSDKQALWETLAQTAVERSGKADMVNNISALAQQLANKDNPGTNTNVIKAVETAIRGNVQEKIQTEVAERLTKYQKDFSLLTTLLNTGNLLTPKAVENNNSLTGAPQNYSKLLNMTATAYGPGPLDNGKWNDLTYVGGKVKKGVVAVDPNVIPMGTKLWVEGYGEAVAEDQGSAIKGNRIDLAFSTRQEALDYGIQKVKVYVLK